RVAIPAGLDAELRALTEGAAVGLLADERDPGRLQLGCEALEALGGTREVRPPQVARPARRPVGGVREADAVLRRVELLVRAQEPRREARVGQEPPEVVARVREVRACGRRNETRVDPTEDDPQAG